MAERAHLSIGEVLCLLQDDFPDVTISKIRFLESQGLLDPERTPSGYRKFYEADIERLRWVLRQQRDHFLPLKVIKDRLDERGAGPRRAGRRARPARRPSSAAGRARRPPAVEPVAAAEPRRPTHRPRPPAPTPDRRRRGRPGASDAAARRTTTARVAAPGRAPAGPPPRPTPGAPPLRRRGRSSRRSTPTRPCGASFTPSTSWPRPAGLDVRASSTSWPLRAARRSQRRGRAPSTTSEPSRWPGPPRASCARASRPATSGSTSWPPSARPGFSSSSCCRCCKQRNPDGPAPGRRPRRAGRARRGAPPRPAAPGHAGTLAPLSGHARTSAGEGRGG